MPHRSHARAALLPVLAIIALFSSPAPARADGVLGAFIGQGFNGSLKDASEAGGTDSITPTIYGGFLGGIGRGVGFEGDFGYSSDLFETSDLGAKVSLTTVMGNLVIGGGRARGVAPYASGGVGLIRMNIEGVGDLLDNLTTNDFGMNVGGGVNIMFGRAGIRGDLRYFRSFQNEQDNILDVGLSDFNFWRWSVGGLVRW